VTETQLAAALVVAGGLFVAGVALVSGPAAFMVAGVLLAALALALSYGSVDDDPHSDEPERGDDRVPVGSVTGVVPPVDVPDYDA